MIKQTDNNIMITTLPYLIEKKYENTTKIIEEIVFDNSVGPNIEWAVILLSHINNDQSLSTLIKIAKTHESFMIRRAAIRALGNHKDPKAAEALLEILEKK